VLVLNSGELRYSAAAPEAEAYINLLDQPHLVSLLGVRLPHNGASGLVGDLLRKEYAKHFSKGLHLLSSDDLKKMFYYNKFY